MSLATGSSPTLMVNREGLRNIHLRGDLCGGHVRLGVVRGRRGRRVKPRVSPRSARGNRPPPHRCLVRVLPRQRDFPRALLCRRFGSHQPPHQGRHRFPLTPTPPRHQAPVTVIGASPVTQWWSLHASESCFFSLVYLWGAGLCIYLFIFRGGAGGRTQDLAPT